MTGTEQEVAVKVLDYLEIGTKKVRIDEEGYLVRFDDWDEEIAEVLAERAGIAGLTKDQRDALRFIREHYRKYSFFPILNAVCKNIHHPKGCVQEEFINPLLAWKLAGLPHPEEPVVSLLKAGQSPG